MKIGLFTDTYLPTINGIVNQVFYLKELLEKRGHEVHIFCPEVKNYNFDDPRIHTYPSIFPLEPFEKLFDIQLGAQFSSPLKDYSKLIKQLDVIHSHHVWLVGNYGAWYAKRYKVPFVFTVHSNYKTLEPGLPMNKQVFHWFWKKILQGYSKKAIVTVSPSIAIKNQLQKYYGILGNHQVIYNGVDVKKFAKKDFSKLKQLKEIYGIQKKDFVLMYAGRLSREKNLEVLFNTLLPLLKKNSRLKLLVVGDGPLQEKLGEMARDVGVEDRVLFSGFIKNGDIVNYYHLAHVLVTTSLSEAFPISLLEAIASGLPILALKGVGIDEIVVSGKNGYLCKKPNEFEKHIQKMQEDLDLYQKLSDGAVKSAQNFSIEKCVDKYEELYKKVQ